MDEHEDETIFSVTDNNELVVAKPEFIRLMLDEASNYMSSFEYAALHSKKHGIIQRYCREGRIKGAIKVGKNWAIPRDAAYPKRAQ